MLTKRIIPCLDVKDGRTVKGINFLQLRDAGDPVALATIYAEQGADELVFLDISATLEGRHTMREVVKNVARQINIPFTVGGGINSVEDVGHLLNAGADKISINSSAVKNPELISQLAKAFGSQCVVVAIDARYINGKAIVHTHGGTKATELETIAWAREIESRGAGEILLTSMDKDGTKSGFDVALTAQVSQAVKLPIIASGGAGSMQHFVDIFNQGQADAALAASIFHFGEIPVPQLKQFLAQQNLPIRL